MIGLGRVNLEFFPGLSIFRFWVKRQKIRVDGRISRAIGSFFTHSPGSGISVERKIKDCKHVRFGESKPDHLRIEP